MEVWGQLHSPPLYPQEGIPLPTEREAVWTSESVWTFWIRNKPLDPSGIRTSACTALVSLYTDCAFLSPTYCEYMSRNYTNSHVPEENILIYDYLKN